MVNPINPYIPNIQYRRVITIDGGNSCGPYFYPDPVFQNPEVIPYNKNGSMKWISVGFHEIFVYKKDPKCLVDNCSLKKQGCASPYTGTDAVMDPLDNYSLKATETNPLGYELYLCYEC